MNRRWMLWGGLAATLAATWYAAGLGDAPGEADLLPPQRARPVAAGAVAPGDAASGAPSLATPSAPATAQTPEGDASPPAAADGARVMRPHAALMPPHDWRPPPPPPPHAIAAPPPQAPPLPFRYLGRLDDGGGLAVFLADGNQPRPLVVRSGDRVRDYEVQSVSARGITFIYLPLNQRQQMLFGSEP